MNKILAQDDDIQSALVEQKRLKRIVHQTKRATPNSEALQLKEGLPASLQRSMELASQKGASNWLSARPLEKYGFVLHKVHLGMLSACDMVGNLKTFQGTALVATASLLIMH